MKPIFSEIQKKKADFIRKNKYAKFSNLRSSQIQDLAVVWCYYSGKIEGNTYTYVETEILLKDGITSPKRYSDAKMLKNLYNAFISCAEQIKTDGQIKINSFTDYFLNRQITRLNDMAPSNAPTFDLTKNRVIQPDCGMGR